jgi:tetratricopeptide (TPR) repeat protein
MRLPRALIRLAGLAVLAAGGWVAGPPAALAEAPTQQRAEPGAMMGERAYRRFEAVSALYSDGRYAEALAALEGYLGGDLNDHERAMGEQLAGYTLLALDRLPAAVPLFERALALDALPNSAHFALMRTLAQVYAANEQWQRAIDTLQAYFRYRGEPADEDRILVAQAHAQLGRPRDALPWVRSALESAGARAPETWHQLELALLFELEDYRRALRSLAALLARWPDRLRYWEMMAGAHQELGEESEALAALMSAYQLGLVTEERKLLNLVRMNLYADLPYSGARLLAGAMEDGRVEANAANLRLLLQAWSAAREFDAAAAVIDRLAPMSGEGELYLQQARLRMEQNDWQATLDSARRALELGNLGSPGQAWLLAGIALMELERLGESREAFRRAQEFDGDTRRQGREWQRFVEERIQVAESRAPIM